MFEKLRKGFELFTRHEKYFFWLLILVYLVPVWSFVFFPTLDGPAHLYNANILYQYGVDASYLSQFYTLNPSPEPNWIGHFILTFFTPVFPVSVCEKLILSIYIVLLPLSFRLLAKTINPHGKYTEYLVFPFIYCFTFYLGFYNFSLGICFFFFSLAYWIRNENRLGWLNVLLMSGLLTLVYFSHVFVFALLCITAGIYLTWNFLFDSVKAKQLYLSSYFKKAGLLLLAAAPGIVLTLNYLSVHATREEGQFIPAGELFKWLKEIRPLVTFNFEIESPFLFKLYYVFIFLILGLWAVKFLGIKSQRANEGVLLLPGKPVSVINRQDVWLLVAAVVLVLYFILPDTMTNGGYVSVRVCLFFFFMLLAWFASQRISKWIAFPLVLVALWTTYGRVKYYMEVSRSLSADATEVFSVEPSIEKNKTLLPLNYSDNWMQGHFSNYLGTVKPLVIMENYEANNKYFPVLWKENMSPYDNMPGFWYRPPCFEPWKYEERTKKPVDYVFTWCYRPELDDSCSAATMKKIDSLYTKIFTSPQGKAVLYKKK